MSESQGPVTGGGDSDPAAGGVPSESDLPRLQGLDEGLPSEPTDDGAGQVVDPDLASDAGSVDGSSVGEAPTGASDPMPDMGGTSTR